jgi:hypothetical protein
LTWTRGRTHMEGCGKAISHFVYLDPTGIMSYIVNMCVSCCHRRDCGCLQGAEGL